MDELEHAKNKKKVVKIHNFFFEWEPSLPFGTLWTMNSIYYYKTTLNPVSVGGGEGETIRFESFYIL